MAGKLIAAYHLGWRETAPVGEKNYGVWMSFRMPGGGAGSDMIGVESDAHLAAYAAVLASGSPAWFSSLDTISTDPDLATSPTLPLRPQSNVLVSWVQSTWSQTGGGTFLLHLVNDVRVKVAVGVAEAARFAALASLFAARTPVFYTSSPQKIVGNPESSPWP